MKTIQNLTGTAAPWRKDFPDIFAFSNVTLFANHANYEEAKHGAVSLDAASAASATAAADAVVGDAWKAGDKKERERGCKELATLAAGAVLLPLQPPPQGNGKVDAGGTPCRNYLPAAFARRLSVETGLPVCEDVFSMRYTGRTAQHIIYRFAAENCPVFWGKVEAGKRYVLCDDVSCLGTSLNELRCYVERNGGIVAGCAVLATQRKGNPFRRGTSAETLALSTKTRSMLLSRIGAKRVSAFLREHSRYDGDIDTLTDGEAQVLLFWWNESAGEFLIHAEDSREFRAGNNAVKSPAPGVEGVPEKLKAGELAALLGVPAQHISRFSAAGRVVPAGGSRYKTRESIAAYCAFLRSPSKIENTPQNREAVARARIAEVKAAEIEGRVIGIETVTSVFGEILISAKNQLLTIPAQVPPAAQTQTKQIIHNVLTELSDSAITLRDQLVDRNRGDMETAASPENEPVDGTVPPSPQ